MRFYLNRTPDIIKWYYASFYWPSPSPFKKLFLTFDDGPNPEITDFILNELSNWQAKATFFCLGENIEKHTSLFNKIITESHTIGNHSFSHLNGWKTLKNPYIKDVMKCHEVLTSNTINPTNLFRPPYGRVSKNQIQELKKTHQIVLWDYLVGDFDSEISKEKCFQKSKKDIRSGDIIVLHDNPKSYETLQYVLPKLLSHYSNLGFTFEAL